MAPGVSGISVGSAGRWSLGISGQSGNPGLWCGPVKGFGVKRRREPVGGMHGRQADNVAARGGGPPYGTGGAGGPRVTEERAQRPTGSQRWLARLAFAAAIAAVVVLLLFGGLKALPRCCWVCGLAIACAAAW
jgi:hypothetical protein